MRTFTTLLFILSFTVHADLDKLPLPKTLKMSRDNFSETFQGKFSWSGKNKMTAQINKGIIYKIPFSEALIKFNKDKLESIDIIFWSKADRDNMTSKGYFQKVDIIKNQLDRIYGVKGKKKIKLGVSKKRGILWLKDKQEIKLVCAYTGKKDEWKGEYIRLSISDINRSDHIKKKQLKSKITQKSNGDTFLDGIPMIDQGDKGYCVCATVARIIQYYGRELSMHEVAEMAGSDADNGTTIPAMLRSLDKVSSKLRIRIKSVKFRSDLVKDYVKEYKISADQKRELERWADNDKLQALYKMGADPANMIKIAEKDRDTLRFAKLIKKYIDKGTPLMWSMTTGVHEEKGIPPNQLGGHMRMIIGYNEKTKEILYSDSWGKGHELKRWSTIKAFTVTSSLNEVTPR